jgi:hypothetical protein
MSYVIALCGSSTEILNLVTEKDLKNGTPSFLYRKAELSFKGRKDLCYVSRYFGEYET